MNDKLPIEFSESPVEPVTIRRSLDFWRDLWVLAGDVEAESVTKGQILRNRAAVEGWPIIELKAPKIDPQAVNGLPTIKP